MNAIDREPSHDELLAQAYVDHELPESDAQAFEARLANEPALAREVAELQGLNLIAKRAAPPEPMDYEWKRLEADPLHTGARSLGLGLVGFGAAGLFLIAVIGVVTTGDLELFPKLLLLAFLLGLAALFFTVLRGRLKTLPYDPYTKVQR